MIGLDLMASSSRAPRARLAGFAWGSGGEGDQGPPSKGDEDKKSGGGDPFGYASLISSIFNAAGNLAEGAGNYVREGQEASARASLTSQATQAAIDADRTATRAAAKAAMSADLKSKTAGQDVKAARAAVAAADKAGAAPGVDRAAREAAARAMVDGAKDDITRRAAQRTLDRIRGVSSRADGAKSDPAVAAAAEESLLARRVAGPVRVWHAAVVAIAAAVAGVALLGGRR